MLLLRGFFAGPSFIFILHIYQSLFVYDSKHLLAMTHKVEIKKYTQSDTLYSAISILEVEGSAWSNLVLSSLKCPLTHWVKEVLPYLSG